MKKLLATSAILATMATSAFAFDANFTTNMSVATINEKSTSSYSVGADASQEFGNIDAYAGVTYDLATNKASKFYVGTSVAGALVTYGDQYGAFTLHGGLTKIRGTVLPQETVGRNIVLNTPWYTASVDVAGNKVNGGELSYTLPKVGGVDLVLGGKYNVDTKNAVVAVEANTKVGQVAVGGILAYSNSFAGELNAGYKGARTFVSFDESGIDTVGAGYSHQLSDTAALYAEVGYHVPTKADTLVVGASLKF